MFKPPVPANNEARIETIAELGLLDPAYVNAFDNIVALTQLATGMPICLFSVLDRERQFFKAKLGIDVRETARHMAFCASAICQENLDDIYFIENAAEHPDFQANPLVIHSPNIRFYAGIPILAPNRFPVGTVCLISDQPGPLDDKIRKALKAAKALMEDALLLHSRSVTDQRTGLYNRRYFEDQSAKEWRRAVRHLLPITLLMIDMDHFKTYLDVHGDAAGDEALAGVATRLRTAANRPGDFVAHYSGEKFVLLLPETPITGGQQIAQRCIERIRELNLPYGAGGQSFLTISVGGSVANHDSDLDGGIKSLLKAAEQNLSRAKTAGGDGQVCSLLPPAVHS